MQMITLLSPIRFYIRSAIQRNLYWYYNADTNSVEISGAYKTKFTIQRTTPLPFDCRPEDDILINEDDIYIFVTTPEWEREKVPDRMIIRSPSMHLKAVDTALNLDDSGSDDGKAKEAEAGIFRFNMFDRGFGVSDVRSWDGKRVFAGTRLNGGERWEFVQ
ncbi:hypothetical protein NP233_g7546 [Leucocoprinus birnbaumii]|uniref:Uncharacterized protein n=1 Tax=Leucocoprinus birnbaumii TaxID=56174 RepID=A0AAD5VQM7_9AGAR|nr:hypothetical protein NP233_g7546 [Leucocoprinus birnbaumii]